MHHLALAGTGDEAGPRFGHLPVEKLQARASFHEQAAGDAGRVLHDVKGAL